MRKHLLLQLIITRKEVAQDAVCQSYYASYKMKIVRCRAFNEGPRRDINGAISSLIKFQKLSLACKKHQ